MPERRIIPNPCLYDKLIYPVRHSFYGAAPGGVQQRQNAPGGDRKYGPDSGTDDKVTVVTNAKGTRLTYKSRGVVDRVLVTRMASAGDEAVVETRAAGRGTEIPVLLTNRLKHPVDTVSVEDYKLVQEPAVTRERRIG